MKLNHFLIAIVFLSITMSSCHRKTSDIQVEDMLDEAQSFEQAVIRYNKNIISPEWFYAKADIKLDVKMFKTSINSRIIVQKDKRALIVAKKFGQEIGRAYATPDTIIIIDRFRQKYFQAYGEEIKTKNLPFTLESLQALMLGQAYYNEIDRHYTGQDSSGFNSYVDPYNLGYIFNEDFLLKKASFKNKNQKQRIESELNDYIQLSDKKIFSKTRDISWFSDDKKQGSVLIEIKDIELEVPKKFSISIPKGYTEMRP